MWLKKDVLSRGGHLLGGQPPSGTDHLPVLEIRDPENLERGSKKSFKPDLVFLLARTIFIVEIKPAFSLADHRKQLELVQSRERIDMFWLELKLRKVSAPPFGNVYANRKSFEIGAALAFEGTMEPDPILWLICGTRGRFIFHAPSGRHG